METIIAMQAYALFEDSNVCAWLPQNAAYLQIIIAWVYTYLDS